MVADLAVVKIAAQFSRDNHDAEQNGIHGLFSRWVGYHGGKPHDRHRRGYFIAMVKNRRGPTAHYEFLQKAFGSGAQAEKTGSLVVGSLDTVREDFTQYASEGNVDYLVTAFPLGDITHEEAMPSLRLFIDEVMPAVRSISG